MSRGNSPLTRRRLWIQKNLFVRKIQPVKIVEGLQRVEQRLAFTMVIGMVRQLRHALPDDFLCRFDSAKKFGGIQLKNGGLIRLNPRIPLLVCHLSPMVIVGGGGKYVCRVSHRVIRDFYLRPSSPLNCWITP